MSGREGGWLARFRPETGGYLPFAEQLKILVPAFSLLLAVCIAARLWSGFERDTVFVFAGAGIVACAGWCAWRIGRASERLTLDEAARRKAEETLAMPFWLVVVREATGGAFALVVLATLLPDWTEDDALFWTAKSFAGVLFVAAPFVAAMYVASAYSARRSAADTLAQTTSS